MNKPVKILLVEDSEDDAKLELRALHNGGFDPTSRRVQSAADLTKALAEESWDAVVSDFAMPGFTGLDALRIFRSTGLDIPFILVSGTIGEEFAANAMKAGASDYVMKNSLARLAPALERELKEAQTRAAHRLTQKALLDSDLRFRQMAENIRDVFFLIDADTSRMLYVSPAYEEIWGRSSESLYGKSWTEAIHPDDRASIYEKNTKGMSEGKFEYEYRILRPDGSIRWIESRGFPVRDEAGKVVRVAGVAKDITERKRAEQELRESRLRLDGIVTSAMDAIVTVDEDKRIVLSNPAAERMFGYTVAELQGQPLDRLMPERFRADHSGHIAAFGKSGVTSRRMGALRPVIGLRKNGEEFPIETSISKDESTGRQFFTAILRDVTEREKSDDRIRRLNRVYAVLTGIDGLIVRVRERDDLFREACRIAVDAGAFKMAWIGVVDPHTLDGRVVAWHGGEEGYIDNIKLTAREGTPDSDRPACRALRLSRPVICNDVSKDASVAPLRDELLRRGHKSVGCFPVTVAGRPEAVLALFAGEPDFFDAEETRLLLDLAGNISFALNHIEKQERLDYLAYYDELTGLANRQLFLERTQQKLLAVGGAGRKSAVVVIDVERFRSINDALGRHVGDELLKEIANRLARASGDATRLARTGADQFAVNVIEVIAEEQLARLFESKFEALFGSPFSAGGTEIRLSGKLGAAVFPDDGADAETLLGNAEAALRKAKSSGERYVFYTQQMTERIAETLSLETKLRQALEKGEFVLHYQPKVDLETRHIAGVEALIRWQSPDKGLVPPMKFIPLLEETGLILQVGSWALKRAALDHLAWTKAGHLAPRIAVNVSAIQLRQRDFVQSVEQAIKAGVAPVGIDLEITESLIMQDVEATIGKLKAVRALGVTVAIDDFGTGYSSLAYLAQLPVAMLKIDRGFIIKMLEDADTMTLVQTMISLAHSLRLKVVAEGVETEDQAKMLKLLRCDQMQGYLFSKPLPLEEITALLRGQIKTAAGAAVVPG